MPIPDADLTVFRAVAFREDAVTGVAVGDGGIFLRTKDGGRTWERADVEGTGNYHDVDYAGDDVWYAVGENRVRRSTDDGRTWTPASVIGVNSDGTIANPDGQPLGFLNLNAVSFISDSIGVIGDYMMEDGFGRMYETRDGGEFWRVRAVFTRLNDIAYDGEGAWYNIGRNVIQRIGVWSTDIDAVVFSAPTSQVLYAGSFATPEIGFVQSEGGVVYRTDDGGATWASPYGGYPTPSHPGANFMRDIDMLDANIGASVGTDGVIGATDSGGGVPLQVLHTHVEEDGLQTHDLPRQVKLDQNYPNPFNPTTMISFHLEHAERVRLDVFDVTGRRVATLVEGAQPAGSHQVRFDASSLASGVYLYRLSSENMVATRTMTLLR